MSRGQFCANCIHRTTCDRESKYSKVCEHYEPTRPSRELKEQRPHNGWVQCSDRLPTAEDGERVLVHICFEKPACEYVYVPWKTVGFEYQVGHIDAWFAIPKYEKEERE